LERVIWPSLNGLLKWMAKRIVVNIFKL
jgi:hypothetical protein